MPSVNQIKNTGQPIDVKVQKPWQYKLLKYLILAFIAGVVFRYFFAPKIEDISEGVYNKTTAESPFYSVITGGKKLCGSGLIVRLASSVKKLWTCCWKMQVWTLSMNIGRFCKIP